MATNHDVWDAVAQTEGTPANSFEMLLRIKQGASSPNAGTFQQTADVTNVNPAFTAKNRMRQTYAAKGVESALKYGETLALTFDIELVRDVNGQFQPVAQDLIDASKGIGVSNLRTIQVFDALGADYALESQFSISVSRQGTGWDEAAFMTVTATQYGTTTWIDNPVLVGITPIIGDVRTVDGAAPTDGDTLYVTGSGFGGLSEGTASNVKVDGVNATSFQVINDNLITFVIPSGNAGVVPVVIGGSNPSAAFLLTRAN